jgi:hypothetical protein
MKKYIFTIFLIVAATATGLRAHGQTPDYLGLPGDNLNLFAVMKLFQESQTLEVFERELNNEDTHINNLDLDQDGRIDYIRVVDHPDGNYHTIVLQDALSPRDIQDVAVFTVNRDRHGRVSIQLTGDEALYGRDYIVEPNYADLDYNETPNPGYTYYNSVNGETVIVQRTSTVEIATWPLIRFIFMPTYVVWQSPYYYDYYPSYWHPWRPYYWHYYYGYHYNWDPYYYGHYRVYHYHRDPYWHDTYYSQRRSYSPVVTSRVESGSYRRTYSHPESRNEGYDMYYKKHPDQVARRSARPIEDPVARTEKRSTTTTGRRTLGESRSRNQGSGTTQPDYRTRTNETIQKNTRTRSTGTSTDSRVSTTNQKPRTLGNRSQTQTQTRTQTQTKTQTRTQPPARTETQTQSRSTGSDQQRGGRSQSATRSEQGSNQSGHGGSQTRQTETRSSGGSERRSSDANTSGASKKPAESKQSGSAQSDEKRGGRRTAE